MHPLASVCRSSPTRHQLVTALVACGAILSSLLGSADVVNAQNVEPVSELIPLPEVRHDGEMSVERAVTDWKPNAVSFTPVPTI